MQQKIDAIVTPFKGKSSLSLGPVAVMAATYPDLDLLCSLMKADKNKGKKLYISSLYAGTEEFESIFIAGPFIGAPYAVMIFETLLAWGAQKIIFTGWCGAISYDVKIGDVVLPKSAYIDEGASVHYGAKKDLSFPDKFLFKQLDMTLKNFDSSSNNFHKGCVWSTDAIYRETIEKVKYYQARDVLAVDMEASALFSAGSFKRSSVCGILTVSDELSTYKWRPGFSHKRFLAGRKAACEIVTRLCCSL
mmetsp:Transcript_794/g.591  ORF Transcript_794/g.591 Transcript_794/m.591 type:complete len:248 (+) Transcript_794:2-745(+)